MVKYWSKIADLEKNYMTIQTVPDITRLGKKQKSLDVELPLHYSKEMVKKCWFGKKSHDNRDCPGYNEIK